MEEVAPLEYTVLPVLLSTMVDLSQPQPDTFTTMHHQCWCQGEDHEIAWKGAEMLICLFWFATVVKNSP